MAHLIVGTGTSICLNRGIENNKSRTKVSCNICPNPALLYTYDKTNYTFGTVGVGGGPFWTYLISVLSTKIHMKGVGGEK